MIFCIDKNSILNLFGVENFNLLESTIDSMSPSLVEYHLANFCNISDDISYFNKRDIENSFSIGEYSIYLDYDENIYLEVQESNLDNLTQSFW
ncbi:hypothetical protein ACNSOS_01075 [Aliarcobacter vitoriensis]|uniref:hypothetical protein n=1 Tax=Aliarcobacter vitoriensis TaxID=2011099 RepID=UPI003AAD4955